MDWGSILGNVASGGVLGLLGTAVSTGLSIWQAREVRATKREEAAARQEEIKLMMTADAAKAAASLKETQEAAAGRAMEASITADSNSHGSSDWVQDVKALVRPALLAILTIFTAVFYFTTENTLVKESIVSSSVTLWFTVVSWYFGQRMVSQGSLAISNK